MEPPSGFENMNPGLRNHPLPTGTLFWLLLRLQWLLSLLTNYVPTDSTYYVFLIIHLLAYFNLLLLPSSSQVCLQGTMI